MAPTLSSHALERKVSETNSVSAAGEKRGLNPLTDYKRHFLKTKQRFDEVTSSQGSRKQELTRASLKQAKLQEELEFLIDAIAGEQLRQQQLQDRVDDNVGEQPKLARNQHRRPLDPKSEVHDDDKEALAERVDADQGRTQAKRARPPSLEAEDELLESAGVASGTGGVSSKRARN